MDAQNIEDIYELSPIQEGIFFHSFFARESDLYCIQLRLRLRGRLDAVAFSRAWQRALNRHSILRTSFHWGEGKRQLQVVHRQVEWTIGEHNWSILPVAERKARLTAFLQANRERGIDLAEPPLMRMALLQMTDDIYELVWIHHHLILDGWSMSSLLNEVFDSYKAEVRREELHLSPARPYRDYIEWLHGQQVNGAEAFWTDQLKGVAAPTQLKVGTSSPAGTVESSASIRRELKLSVSTITALQAFARSHHLTLNTIVLGAWALLLSRYSRESDVLFGSVVSDRAVELQGAESIIGPLINTLPMRVRIDSQATVVTWLKEIQIQLAQMRRYSSTPLARIQGWSDIPRGQSFFEMAFAFENYPIGGAWQGEDTPLEIIEIGHDSRTNYALAAVALTSPDLVLRLTGDGSRFAADSLDQMLGHLENLLKEMSVDGWRRLAQIPVLTEAERQLSIVEWNRTESEYPEDKCVHQLFEDQVRRTPSAVAIVHHGHYVTYWELNRRANQLAHYLRRLGVGPEVLVGICLPRSLEMLLGLFGVLKAGGGYVPLDPAYPVERLGFMMQDAALSIVIMPESLAERLPAPWRAHIDLEADWEAIAQESEQNPSGQTMPDHAVYAIYTSGSTGRPKGALLTHRGLCNTINTQRRRFGVTPESRVIQLASVSFDASLFEIMLALPVGAALCLGEPEWSLPGSSLLRALREEQITVALFTPSVLAILPDEPLPALKTIITAGEACPLDLVERWGGGRRFYNAYGPTEATIWTTVAECRNDPPRVSLGRPISNIKVYLFDADLQPVPMGVPGELHIGGIGLGRGYLDRPDLTAEKWIPNGVGAEPGSRLYRTGDLACYGPSGEMEFLGRVDRQVKVRGFRIETEEVEAVLKTHSAVHQAVVMTRTDATGNNRLIAYLVPRREPLPAAGELRGFLRMKLPEYMLPAAFIGLDSLPLTVNGKLDLSRLPEHEHRQPDLGRPSASPRTDLELFLADCWRRATGITDEIGIHDNFFELGGDSISAAVVVNMLQDRLNEIVHVVAMFDAPTIAELVEYLYRHNYQSTSRIFGMRGSEHQGPGAHQPVSASALPIRSETVEQMRRLIVPLSSPTSAGPGIKEKNPPVIFILSAPRSGSTLFRVILGGNPLLFAPPELELLSFNTLGERRDYFSGRDSFWLEGTIRAIKQIRGCTAEEAGRVMQEYEEQNLGMQGFYRLLQDWIGNRKLVDKTPAYALDLDILKRAEAFFDNALYLHLVRHPYGMIRSFEEARLDQLLSRYPHPFSRREFAELVWVISQQNILRFLAEVPSSRQHRVKFEDLVADSRQTIEGVCRFLEIDPHPDMLQPYQNEKQRMTDGLYAASRMLGDVKFHEHTGIDARVATNWRAQGDLGALGEVTWEIAEICGYHQIDGFARIHRRPTEGRLTSIHPAGRGDRTKLPLSFAQQRLWLLDQLEPGTLSYNCAGAIRMKGDLYIEAIQQSFNEIVRRHEILRTAFPFVDGSPLQAISSVRSESLLCLDLRAIPAAQRESEVRERIKTEAAKPFDLPQGPLVRGAFLRLSNDDQVLLVIMHHIISDGWSVGVFMRELKTLYQAFISGLPSPLAELPIQYADFAQWQREWLQGEVLEAHLDYWRPQLEGAPAVLQLPTDRPRPAVQRFRGAKQGLVVEAETTSGLKKLGREEGATLFMVLLAAFKVLLWRWSGEADVVVGTPMAGRTRAETESLIGFFVNTLVLRTRLRAEGSFRGLVGEVREVCLGAYAHQEVPFEKLVEELRPERSLSHTPLFQAFFNLHNARDNRLELSGLIVEELEPEIPASKFDLTLHAREQRGDIYLELLYDADLFDAGRMVEMIRQLTHLLAQAVEHPEWAIGRYSLVTPEAELVLPRPSMPLPAASDETVITRFARQARRHPERPAVIDNHDQWSYEELDVHSSQLADYLFVNGIGRRDVVAIYAHRSASLVWALLGALKAGAAFMILDPTYPAARLTDYLRSAQPRVWIQLEAAGELPQVLEHFLQTSSCHFRLTLPDKKGASDSDFLKDYAAAGLSRPARSAIEANDLAYVAFTSGSTGEPKGILGSHKPLSHFYNWQSLTFELCESDRFSMLSGLAHDPLLRDVFTPLWVGATLCIPSAEELAEPCRLVDWMKRERITVTHLTPAMSRFLTGAIGEVSEGMGVSGPVLPSLRYVFLGGDVLTQHEVLRMRRLAESATCVNFYGSTETPQAIAYHLIADEKNGIVFPSEQPCAAAVSIGRGIADVQLLVLNAARQLAGVGELGEIYVRTPYLSRGYLGDERLTAARFVANPFSGMNGDYMYRTGDLGRYLPDGTVMYAGRADRQVKIRGFRVELEEVEAVLGQWLAVQSVAVVARPNVFGDQHLIAYIVPKAGSAPTVSELREWLGERLSNYMIPSTVVRLERLPLTPNGKIDYRALPDPGPTQSALNGIFVAPRTPVEKEMSDIWSAILGVERIGIHDNFFDLGGHSLLAMQVISRIREAYHLELPLRTLFIRPTLSELALAVTQMQLELEG
jgi:amino acid adenylation domain-containing protein